MVQIAMVELYSVINDCCTVPDSFGFVGSRYDYYESCRYRIEIIKKYTEYESFASCTTSIVWPSRFYSKEKKKVKSGIVGRGWRTFLYLEVTLYPRF